MPKSVENTIMDSFELVKENYAKFLLVYLVMIVVSILVLLVFAAFILLGAGGSAVLGSTAPILGAVLLGIIVLFLVSPIWVGTYYSMALQGLGNKRISIYDAIGTTKKRYVDLLLVIFLQIIIYVIVYAIIFYPIIGPVLAFVHGYGGLVAGGSPVLGSLLKLAVLGVLILIAALIATFILMPLLYEAVPLVLLEGLGGVDAVRRSIALGRKNFWKIVWLLTVFWFVVGMIYVGEWIVAAIFGLLSPLIGAIISIVLSLAVGALVAAWSYALQIVFYKEFIDNKK